MLRYIVLIALSCLALAARADEWTARRHVATDFDETREAITMAIENRGLVVNYVSHIADMLNRTGADIGAARKIYERGEIIEFCSAGLSRRMMEANPHDIVYCPFAIALYQLPGESGTWITYRRPQGKAANIVAPLLEEIAGEAGP